MRREGKAFDTPRCEPHGDSAEEHGQDGEQGQEAQVAEIEKRGVRERYGEKGADEGESQAEACALCRALGECEELRNV